MPFLMSPRIVHLEKIKRNKKRNQTLCRCHLFASHSQGAIESLSWVGEGRYDAIAALPSPMQSPYNRTKRHSCWRGVCGSYLNVLFSGPKSKWSFQLWIRRWSIFAGVDCDQRVFHRRRWWSLCFTGFDMSKMLLFCICTKSYMLLIDKSTSIEVY